MINIKEAETYLSSKTAEEETPVNFESRTNVRYFNLNQLFNTFYPQNSLEIAKQQSRAERNLKGIKDTSFTYGEITFRSLAYIYEFIKYTYGKRLVHGNFIDLGSGSGKGVVAMSLIAPFKKMIGIEILENLNRLSVEIKKKYDITIKEKYIKFKELFTFKNINEIIFIKNDFLNVKWSSASFILCNSTCFSTDLMTSIAVKANKECEKGTVIVTFSKQLTSLDDTWEKAESFKRLMTWGIATIFIYFKAS